MARVRNLLSKLKEALTQEFPTPASVRLEDHDGIIGVITSTKFAGMDTIDRQNLIGAILTTRLTPEECRAVQVIVGVTPDEGTGYLADDVSPRRREPKTAEK
jgi:hypothetical protein